MTRYPVAGQPPAAAQRPKSGGAPEKKYFQFSLRYWRQIEQFGVGDQTGSWFISLLQRLADLCKEQQEDVLSNVNLRDALRIHDINWLAKGIKTKLSDLDWIPESYRTNKAEFPLMQIHISKANGRIIGFIDEGQVFNVVLLDPHHNLQPSKYNGWSIRPTRIGGDELTRARLCFERAITGHPKLSQEVKAELLSEATRDNVDGDVVVTMQFTHTQAKAVDEGLAAGSASDAAAFILLCVEEYVTS